MNSTLYPDQGTMFAHALRGVETCFTVTMEDSYESKIGHEDFDPKTVFREMATLANELSNVFNTGLTPRQEAAFENHILHSLAWMVYCSNKIEKAGSNSEITLKLCLAIFCGKEIREEIEEQDQEYLSLKESLISQNLPADISAVLRSRREVIQHAKAAAFMIDQLCIRGQDLSEQIILEAHRILTYKVDAETTPWMEYSGVYRSHEVSAGLHAFPHPSLVPYKMKSMFHELKCDLKEATTNGTIDPIALASKYTHIFVNIHPFIDGNGRMCRLILNSMLLKFGAFLACIGVDEDDRSIYMEIAMNGGALEYLYEDAEEEEKPKLYKELASYVLGHVKKSMTGLVSAVAQ
jgi:Fic family protein